MHTAGLSQVKSVEDVTQAQTTGLVCAEIASQMMRDTTFGVVVCVDNQRLGIQKSFGPRFLPSLYVFSHESLTSAVALNDTLIH